MCVSCVARTLCLVSGWMGNGLEVEEVVMERPGLCAENPAWATGEFQSILDQHQRPLGKSLNPEAGESDPALLTHTSFLLCAFFWHEMQWEEPCVSREHKVDPEGPRSNPLGLCFYLQRAGVITPGIVRIGGDRGKRAGPGSRLHTGHNSSRRCDPAFAGKWVLCLGIPHFRFCYREQSCVCNEDTSVSLYVLCAV